MVAWDRRDTSLSGEEVFTDSSPGLWEALSVDPDAQEDLGAPLIQAVDLLQDMVGSGLQAILSGDWQQFVDLVEEVPLHPVAPHAMGQGPDVVPI